jgi:hypothetical protein
MACSRDQRNFESWHPDCKVIGKHLIQSVRPEPFGCAQESLVEGHFRTLILSDLFVSWFDKLTTNGIKRFLSK